MFGPPGLAGLRRLGAILERRSDASLELQLRQAGYADVTPDEYRSRMAMQVLGFGAAGGALGVLAFHGALIAVGLTLCGVVFGASRFGAGSNAALPTDGSASGSSCTPSTNSSRCTCVPVPVRCRPRNESSTAAAASSSTSCTPHSWPRVTASPSLGRSVVPPRSRPSPPRARTYKLFAAGAERGVDLVDGLRTLSEDLRDARREEIRTTATKRRAAMLVPTIAVLAPVMLLFIAAPLPSIVFGSR